MSISQLLLQLISETPGSLVYQLVTLFAAQAMLAMGWWQYNRRRRDDWARRLTWVGAGIILTRLTMGAVVAFLSVNNNTGQTAAIYPPLEQALFTATIILILWAIMPANNISVRLRDAILLVAILINVVLYIFFAPSWTTELRANPNLPFAGTLQAIIWSILQLALLLAGMVIMLWRDRDVDRWLRFMILFTLFAAHGAHALNLLPALTNGDNSNFWLRLGHLLAIPLLAIFAYRHNLYELLREQWRNRPAVEQLTEALRRATPLFVATNQNERLAQAVMFAGDFTGSQFAGIGLPHPTYPEQLQLFSLTSQREAMQWQIPLPAFPALQQALNQQKSLELQPKGMGAKQLHELYRELDVRSAGSMLIEPMVVGDRTVGLLTIANHSEQSGWHTTQRALAKTVAGYLAHLFQNEGIEQVDRVENAGTPTDQLAIEAQQADLTHLQEQLNHATVTQQQTETDLKTVQLEVEQAQSEITRLEQALQTAQQQYATAQQNSDQLTQTIAQLQQKNEGANIAQKTIRRLEKELKTARQNALELGQRTDQLEEELSALEVNSMVAQMNAPNLTNSEREAQLEAEIQDLRTALLTAEEALAMASTKEGEISSEWVMNTITRYSAELEDAYSRIVQLETALAQLKNVKSGTVMISLAQELRTPMTSIAGYTDLLISESAGLLVKKQRDMLQRVQSNVERMGALLDQIIQSADAQHRMDEDSSFDTRETIETAMNATLPRLREKRLQLRMDLHQALPALSISRSSLYQIVLNLLNNAALASDELGVVGVKAQVDLLEQGKMAQNGVQGFLRLEVSDSGGGIHPDDLGRVFEPHLEATAPLIAGIGETGIGLSATYALVSEHGGRIWIDSELGKGTVFTTLLPISNGTHQPE